VDAVRDAVVDDAELEDSFEDGGELAGFDD
jgi:hypothetical protein